MCIESFPVIMNLWMRQENKLECWKCPPNFNINIDNWFDYKGRENYRDWYVNDKGGMLTIIECESEFNIFPISYAQISMYVPKIPLDHMAHNIKLNPRQNSIVLRVFSMPN